MSKVRLVGIKFSAQKLNLSEQATRKLFKSGKLETAGKLEGVWVAQLNEVEALSKERAEAKVELGEGYVGITEIAQMTGYNTQYVRKLMVKGRWESEKINGKWVAQLELVESDSSKLNEFSAPEGFVTLAEFSTRTGYNIHYSRKLARENKIDTIKEGGAYYVSEKTLADRIEKISIRAQLKEMNGS